MYEQAQAQERTRLFKNHTISPNWWLAFKDRHPELKKRNGRLLEDERTGRVTPEVINPFFDVFEDIAEVRLTIQ